MLISRLYNKNMRIFLEKNDHYKVVSGPGNINLRVINSVTLFDQTKQIIQAGLASQYLYRILA